MQLLTHANIENLNEIDFSQHCKANYAVNPLHSWLQH